MVLADPECMQPDFISEHRFVDDVTEHVRGGMQGSIGGGR